ncbi:MAG: o-succinylbenzoate synthase, partial [Acidobacteria bacterium]|nr:o-succinylbenzoate synthase [Acidobacteriota bacterium]
MAISRAAAAVALILVGGAGGWWLHGLQGDQGPAVAGLAERGLAGRSLADYLGATAKTVAPGVVIGLHDDVSETLEVAQRCLEEGYARIKLKIEPGRDVSIVEAIRRHVGDSVMLQVDANGAYTLGDLEHLSGLDDFGLALIEQPLAADDLEAHASLARSLRTPVCLDESITSLRVAREAIELRACSIINVKPGRIGGYLEAKRMHDLCIAENIPVLCGGMFESGVGRAANLALAAMEGFSLPPDLSASSRYFLEDVTEPFELIDGEIEVPTGPGIGVVPGQDQLSNLGAVVTEIRPSSSAS